MHTVPAAKAALKALLEAHAWPENTPDIRWGGPTESEDFSQGGELIYFAETTVEIPQDSLLLGRSGFSREFVIRLEVLVIQYGDDEQATESRGWDLVTEVESVLDAYENRSLSGTVNSLTSRTVRQINGPQVDQWVTRMIVEQGCVAHISNPQPQP